MLGMWIRIEHDGSTGTHAPLVAVANQRPDGDAEICLPVKTKVTDCARIDAASASLQCINDLRRPYLGCARH